MNNAEEFVHHMGSSERDGIKWANNHGQGALTWI